MLIMLGYLLAFLSCHAAFLFVYRARLFALWAYWFLLLLLFSLLR